jgi:hypothetical protein
MRIDLSAHKHNGTFRKMPRTQFYKRKWIKSKFVFDLKFNHDGTINKYKARWVARGFTQRHGIDYEETFAPTLALMSVRTIIAMAAARGKTLYQVDIPTAFIRSELIDEEIIIEPPEVPAELLSILHNDQFYICSPDEILLLVKALYGLKQSPRVWFGNISSTLNRVGFEQSTSDRCKR